MASGAGDPPLRVLVVDDHAFYRSGLRSMLAAAGLAVTEAATGEAAVAAVATDPPDVVLMDLGLPGMSGIEATRRLGAAAPGVPVGILTISADDRDVVAAVRAGARGYLLKDGAVEEIVASVRAVAAGRAWITPHVTSALVTRVREGEGGPPDEQAPEVFTARELDVLRLVAAGRDNAAIGRELYISTGTVRKCVSSILTKLGVESRVEAAVYAVRRGLT